MKSPPFSLIELLVVTSILLILGTLISPSLVKTISLVKTTHCQKNLQEVFSAISLYTEDQNHRYPGPADHWNSPHFSPSQSTGLTRKISPYLISLEIPHSRSYRWPLFYLPSFICPANQDLELNADVRRRAQFIQHSNQNIHPFGIKANKYRYTRNSQYSHEIENPSNSKALSDVYSPYYAVPDLPVHYGYTVNALFLDGHTENLQISF